MNSVHRHYNERRNFLRIEVDTPVEVKVENKNLTLPGQCINLSGGGMLVELERALALNTALEVMIDPEHKNARRLRAKTIVKRIEPSTPHHYHVGMGIGEILPY